MVSLWLLGGILILSVGIIGVYLSRVFIETKHRPYTIVRRVHGREAMEHLS
jgi:putative glycosyltransferase